MRKSRNGQSYLLKVKITLTIIVNGLENLV